MLPPVVDDVGLESIGAVTNVTGLDLRAYRSITDAGLCMWLGYRNSGPWLFPRRPAMLDCGIWLR